MIDILEQGAWGALPPRKTSNLRGFSEGWIAHWPGVVYKNKTTPEILRSIQKFHMTDRGWLNISYSFAVDQAGSAWTLRGWGIEGGHTAGKAPNGHRYNQYSMAILFLYGPGEDVSSEMIEAAEGILAVGESKGYPSGLVRPHCTMSRTECPGEPVIEWTKTPAALGAMTPGSTSDEYIVRVQRAANRMGFDLKEDGFSGPLTAAVIERLAVRDVGALRSLEASRSVV